MASCTFSAVCVFETATSSICSALRPLFRAASATSSRTCASLIAVCSIGELFTVGDNGQAFSRGCSPRNRSRKMVDLDQSDAGCAARAVDDGGKVAGIEVDQQCGFQIVSWSQPCCRYRALFCPFPIVVRSQAGSLRVEQVERWIEQRILNASAGEGRADRAKKERRWIRPRHNYTSDHGAIIEAHEAARADIHEPST